MTQALLSGTTDADRFARALARLRGTEIQPADGTMVAEDLRVLGQLLADARSTTQRAVAQARPGSATDLLSELESEYGLPDGSARTVADRQRRLLAKYRARNAGDRLSLLKTIRTVAAEAQIATTPYDSVAGTDPTAVFRFAILLSEAHFNDAALQAQINALLQQQVTGHADWVIGRNLGFRCGDPDSLCDTDLLAF